VIGADTRDSCSEKRVKGDPADAKRKAARRLPNRPRKASAWSENQQARLTEPIIKERLSLKLLKQKNPNRLNSLHTKTLSLLKNGLYAQKKRI
jgi:hypothetical protein